MSKRKEQKKDFTVVGQEVKQQQPTAQVQPKEVPMTFDEWWLQTQQKLKLKPELKLAMRKHFEARGFINDSKKFNDGLKDFGFKA